jgi:hypothetical protein
MTTQHCLYCIYYTYIWIYILTHLFIRSFRPCKDLGRLTGRFLILFRHLVGLGRVISLSQRPLPTKDNTTQKYDDKHPCLSGIRTYDLSSRFWRSYRYFKHCTLKQLESQWQNFDVVEIATEKLGGHLFFDCHKQMACASRRVGLGTMSV